MKNISIRSPYSGKLLSKLSFLNDHEISGAIQNSKLAFQKWRHSSAWDRSQLLNNAALKLEAQKEDFASLICAEAGKPIQLARGEVDRAVSVLRWSAAEAQRFSGELLRLDAGAAGRSGFGIHTRFPRGIILGITPFNFPLNLVLHKVAPAIACGCSILIKPSPFTPLTAIKIAQLFEGAPQGLVETLIIDDAATEKLTQAPEVAMISFTGSARVGWMIRKQAPQKPTALELGGNAWMIVMEDTPASSFPAIARRIAQAAFGYAGQSCISVQNVAIASSLWSTLHPKLKKATRETPYGDPSHSSVVTGPVINASAAERIRSQLKQLPTGAQVISSEIKTPTGKKGNENSAQNLIPPTLISFSNKTSQSSPLIHPLIQEEPFAPVMTACPFGDLSGLISKINSSRYGLQTGVFTQNWAVIERLYRDVEVGGVIVNDVPTTRYDHQPYGGIKDSGFGREGIKYAMEEMTESKFLALSSQIL